jgi:putative ABC transport system permease protein
LDRHDDRSCGGDRPTPRSYPAHRTRHDPWRRGLRRHHRPRRHRARPGLGALRRPQGHRGPNPGRPPDGTNPFPENVDQRLEALNGIQHAGLIYPISNTGTLQPRNTATRPTGSYQSIPLVAATPGALQAALPELATGRLYDDFHQQRAERVAVIGRVAAEQLGISRIDNQPAIFIGDTAYTVVGVLADVARNPDLLLSITIPTSTEHQDIGTNSPTYEVLIDTAPGAASLAGRQAPRALHPQQPERLQALVPPDPHSLRNNVEGDVTALYYALAALALLIGTIAIANATLLNTIERRPEIALRRALGATRPHIVRQITVEAATTGAIAGIAGTAIAIYAIAAVAHERSWTATVDPTTTLAAPLIGLVTGTFAGIVPALRASQTPPATALRT